MREKRSKNVLRHTPQATNHGGYGVRSKSLQFWRLENLFIIFVGFAYGELQDGHDTTQPNMIFVKRMREAEDHLLNG